MKKLILSLIASSLLAIPAVAQQTYNVHKFGRDIVTTTVNGFSETLAPVPVNSGKLVGFSLSYATAVEAIVEFGYIRNGIITVVFSAATNPEESETARTFSWEPNLTGGWYIIPGDTLYCTSSSTATGQITFTIDRTLD